MTRKVYKSAMGKPVDLGALLLQNEQVRAVGNMGVNAAGDLIDSTNRVIDQRNRQVQKQYKKQTNVSGNTPIATSNLDARKKQPETTSDSELDVSINFDQAPDEQSEPVQTSSNLTDSGTESNIAAGGLASAIARSREIKQELEKSLRQRQQEQGIRKL